MGAPIGTMIGFVFAARIARGLGLKKTCLVSGAAMSLALILPAVAWSGTVLFLALVVVGFSIAVIEVAMNSKANAVQHDLERRIMSRCHGMWSFGVMFAGLLAGLFAQSGVTPLVQQVIMEPITAVFAILFALALPDDTAKDAVEESGFATDRFGVPRMILVSGISMAFGILLFSFSQGLGVAGMGAVLAGIGAANVYPLAISIAPDVKGGTPEGNVAAIALTAFTAFLIGPPLIGFVGDRFGLSIGFMVLTPLAFIPALFVLTGWISRITGDEDG